ncbi:MAG: multidrug ABC transporter ATP-binding protein, partial [Oceanococcus sp.]
MKRRVMIAKALSHEPDILFLDEPTAGVDVELRRDMWAMVADLRASGVTIILTTHYIEEAEEMADRIGIIHSGELILVDEKSALMQQLGQKQLNLSLLEPLHELPEGLADWPVELKAQGQELSYSFNANEDRQAMSQLMRKLDQLNIAFKDVNTRESSLEEIFVDLVNQRDGAQA